jgi:hypothetical protein
MCSATLIGRWWGGRRFLVRCDDEVFTVKYTPWGWNAESVSVNDVVAVRRSGHRMSHGYRFRLGDRLASLSVAVPWWAETLPLSDLNFVRLEVDGEVLYEEGRAPTRPLDWTVAAEGFPVVPGAKR